MAVTTMSYISFRNPDCLLSRSDNNFLDNFCTGPRGQRGTSFDYQCQHFHGYGPEWTECFGVVSSRISFYAKSRNLNEHTFGHVRPAKIQISLRIRAV